MSNKFLKSLFCLSVIASPSVVIGEKKKSEYHCEKKVDGKIVDLKEVKSRKECKKKGGKWQKNNHKHDEHGKKDSHKHEGHGENEKHDDHDH